MFLIIGTIIEFMIIMELGVCIFCIYFRDGKKHD